MSGLDVIVGVIGLDPILTRGHQLVEQYRIYKENRKRSHELRDSFKSFQYELSICITQLQGEADKLPPQSREIISDDVVSLRSSLVEAEGVLRSISKLLTGNPILHFARAKKVSAECERLSDVIKTAQDLRRNAKTYSDLRSALHDIQSASSVPMDNFQKAFPVMSVVRAVLDFDSSDDNHNPTTPEGWVRKHLMDDSCQRGGVISIRGIGGVGKSTILKAIACNPQVRQRYPDGVHIIKLGMDATPRTLFDELCKVLRDSGAAKTEQVLRARNQVNDAIREALLWFRGKSSCFLIDDAWTKNISLTLFSRLCDLAGDGKQSRVLITTRQHDIASLAQRQRIVSVKPRDPHGLQSRRILFLHADVSDSDAAESVAEESICAVLTVCAGLPVSLAAAAKSLKMLRMDMTTQEEHVWKRYAAWLKACCDQVLREDIDEYENFMATFAVAVSMLDERRMKNRFGLATRLSYAEMYRRLCVLRKQTEVPASMLKQLWELETEAHAELVATRFIELGLASNSSEKRDSSWVWRMSIHDSLHDFAMAEAVRHDEVKLAHERLLLSYSLCDPQLISGDQHLSQWWSLRLLPDGYIHANLCLHLLMAKRVPELLETLLTPEWAERQLRVNGVMNLEADFLLGIRAIQNAEICTETLQALTLVLEALKLSTGLLIRNPREVWCQLQGRLKGIAEDNEPLRRFLIRLVTRAPKPSVVSVCPFLTAPGGAVTRCFSVEDPLSRLTVLNGGTRIASMGFHSMVFLDLKRSDMERLDHVSVKRALCSDISKDGKLIVMGTMNNTAIVWNIENGTYVSSFCGHVADVSCLAFMKDQRFVISGSHDNTLRMWKMKTGQPVRGPFSGHEDTVTCVTTFPDGIRFASGGDDMTVRIWSTTSGAQAKVLTGHEDTVECLAVTPDGRHLTSGSRDKTVRVWSAETGTQIGRALVGHFSPVVSIAVSLDGNLIASGSTDHTIRIWSLHLREHMYDPLRGHSESVSGISFSGGSTLVSCSLDGTLRVWDLNRVHVAPKTEGHEECVTSISFTPNGRLVSGSKDNTIRVWSQESGLQLGPPLRGHSSGVTGVAVTRDAKLLVSISSDHTIRLWDLQSRTELITIAAPNRTFECVALTPQGDHLLTGCTDIVQVWNLAPMDGQYKTLTGHHGTVRRVLVSDDGRRVISISRTDESSDGSGQVLKREKRLLNYQGYSAEVSNIAEDENALFCEYNDFPSVGNVVEGEEEIRVWDIKSGICIKRTTQKEALSLSRQAIMDLISEGAGHQETCLSILPGSREIKYGDHILCTVEADIEAWDVSPDERTIAVGLKDGQVGIMTLKT